MSEKERPMNFGHALKMFWENKAKEKEEKERRAKKSDDR